MPSGKTARPNITDNKDGTITVRYAPTEKGLHQMGVKYDGNHIPGKSGPGWEEPTVTSFLPSFFQQMLTERLLYADTTLGPGEAVSWWEAGTKAAGRHLGAMVGLRRLPSSTDPVPFLGLPQEAPYSSTWMPSTAAT